MPKYKVKLQRPVTEDIEVEIEAPDKRSATGVAADQTNKRLPGLPWIVLTREEIPEPLLYTGIVRTSNAETLLRYYKKCTRADCKAEAEAAGETLVYLFEGHVTPIS
jgi:hypothetical protein